VARIRRPPVRNSEVVSIGADGRRCPAVGCTSEPATSADGGGGTDKTGST